MFSSFILTQTKQNIAEGIEQEGKDNCKHHVPPVGVPRTVHAK